MWVQRVVADPEVVVASYEEWELVPALVRVMEGSQAVEGALEVRPRHQIWWPVV